MNLAVLGSGGREHAICYKLKQSSKIKKLFCIPGNAGTQKIAQNIKEDISNFEKLYQIIIKNKIDLVIVGPEQPLVDGIVDFLDKKKVKVFGPDKYASQLEGSKAFMKNLCKKNNIPTANFGIFDNFDDASKFIKKNGAPIVVKADGLASGKGVTICKSTEEALKNTKEILEGKFKSTHQVVLEEFLEGEELSYFVIVDKNSYLFFGSAQDHKRVGEGDVGPNTGGMGAYSPSPLLTKELEKKIKKKIIEPTLKAMKDLGHPYKGFLYAGLMIKKGEPYLIEYNIRMGDPECQVTIPLIASDLGDLLAAAANDELHDISVEFHDACALTVVLAAEGYPGPVTNGKSITGISACEGGWVNHAATEIRAGELVSTGGRVLACTGISTDLKGAASIAYSLIDNITLQGSHHRRDIGYRAL